MSKPLLFIDVDGVLFATYEGCFQLRPSVNSFLKWCTEHFECAWLTCWAHEPLKALFGHTYGDRYADKIKYCSWQPYDHNKAKGAIAYAAGRPFLWIEDGVPEDEREILNQHGLLDNYIFVMPDGKNELVQVQQTLNKRRKAIGGGE